MTTIFNPVALIQEEIAARLNADPYFVDITVLTERTKDLVNEVQRALKVITEKDDKIGVAVVVGAYEVKVTSTDAPGPHFDDGTTDVTVFENPIFNDGANGTGKAAVDIAVRVAQILHHYYAAGIGQTLLAESLEPLGATEDGEIAYKLIVRSPANSVELDKVERPVIAPTEGATPIEVTLTSDTVDAEIYYTLNDTYPWSGNDDATLYAAPFTVAAAATLRAVAHKTGLVASDAAAATFT